MNEIKPYPEDILALIRSELREGIVDEESLSRLRAPSIDQMLLVGLKPKPFEEAVEPAAVLIEWDSGKKGETHQGLRRWVSRNTAYTALLAFVEENPAGVCGTCGTKTREDTATCGKCKDVPF